MSLSCYFCRSVFYLPKPRALNWLVASAFGKPTLVLQVGVGHTCHA